MDRPEGFGAAALLPAFSWGQPLFWRWTANGLKTNVRWVVRQHSVTGLNIGYVGSDPADLALNAMAALFPGNEERCLDGWCSTKAWHLHQHFKFRFLNHLDPKTGRIEWEEIKVWLEEQKAKEQALDISKKVAERYQMCRCCGSDEIAIAVEQGSKPPKISVFCLSCQYRDEIDYKNYADE